MEHISTGALPQRAQSGQGGNAGPLAIITALFFMWGALTALNDVLVPHLKALYTLTYVQAMLVQFCFFGAYGIVSLPAGMLIRRIGYRRGVVGGLLVAAAGCALFYPAASGSYGLFLLAFFVLAAGITVLQVAANPFVTALGPPATASSRLTLTQAFNALGTALAPWLGGMLILSGTVLGAEELAQLAPAAQDAYRAAQADLVRGPYLALAAVLLGLGALFALLRGPDPRQLAQHAAPAPWSALLAQRHLLLGAAGIFLYVGAEVSVGSLLINFLGQRDVAGLSPALAAPYVSLYWGGAMVGRFIGFAVMRRVRPGMALAASAAVVVGLLMLGVFGGGALAMWAVIAVGLFNSIMFPTIFSMSLHRLGGLTGQGSGLLCMAIVGGALVPFGQALVADALGLRLSFLVPAACYGFILYYGLQFANLYARPSAEEAV
jgi:FHS family L-fucose permease-like MFS transporter